MTPEQKDYLKHCNGFGFWGGNWHPYCKHHGEYFDPHGLNCVPPEKWRWASHEEIVSEMESRNEFPLMWPNREYEYHE